EAKIPMVSETASDDHLSNISHYFFHVAPLNEKQAEAAQHFTKMLHVTRAVVFLDPKDGYSQNIAGDFETNFKRLGGTILKEETFKANQTNKKDFETKIQDALN